MIIGQRLAASMRDNGLSQSELARRVSLSQQTIHKLITGASRSSAHLHRIARELHTTPAYLTGETNDPDEGAAPPPLAPTIQLVPMAVALPSEDVLREMFLGLLETAPAQASRDELAQTLAELLPIGLGQLQGQMLRRAPVAAGEPEARPEVDASEGRARRQASST